MFISIQLEPRLEAIRPHWLRSSRICRFLYLPNAVDTPPQLFGLGTGRLSVETRLNPNDPSLQRVCWLVFTRAISGSRTVFFFMSLSLFHTRIKMDSKLQSNLSWNFGGKFSLTHDEAEFWSQIRRHRKAHSAGCLVVTVTVEVQPIAHNVIFQSLGVANGAIDHPVPESALTPPFMLMD